VLHYGLLGPAGLPRPVVDKLNAAMRQVAGTDEVKKRINNEGGDPLTSTPEEYAADIDKEFAQDKDFVAAMGEDGMKKLAELETQALESRQSNLFSFNPRMSYPPERWVKADPDFWKPKPAAIKKAPEKPAPK